MATASLDYSKLAQFYDDYCVFSGDVNFFRSRACRIGGRVLELMAGTGRVSLPLAQAGVDLTCVDNSVAMLSVLMGKIQATDSVPELVCADVRALPLCRKYDLVLLPFQGLTELLTSEDQLSALRSVYRVLADSGRFICTSHNPAVRLRTVDGAWHELGEFQRSGGGSLRLSLRASFNNVSGQVVGQQRIVAYDLTGASRVIDIGLQFSLVSAEQLTGLVEECGFRVSRMLGDYSGGRFDPEESPVIIAVLEKSA